MLKCSDDAKAKLKHAIDEKYDVKFSQYNWNLNDLSGIDQGAIDQQKADAMQHIDQDASSESSSLHTDDTPLDRTASAIAMRTNSQVLISGRVSDERSSKSKSNESKTERSSNSNSQKSQKKATPQPRVLSRSTSHELK